MAGFKKVFVVTILTFCSHSFLAQSVTKKEDKTVKKVNIKKQTDIKNTDTKELKTKGFNKKSMPIVKKRLSRDESKKMYLNQTKKEPIKNSGL